MTVDFDNDIVRRCQREDIQAYRLVYDHFAQPLLRLGMTMLNRQEDAEDAVQTTFLRLYRNIDQFDFKSKFGAYLYRIMVNVCLDMREKISRERAQAAPSVEPSYQPAYDLSLQLREAIATLPDRMRACFILFAVEDMKQTDIAKIMELSPGTVKAHIFQAKTRLQALLADSRSEVKP